MTGLATRVAAAALAAAAVTAAVPHAAAQAPAADVVYTFDLTGTVDPLVARGFERAVRTAERERAGLFVRIDTPGGLDSAMRRIVKAILGAKAAVTCWVGPEGARAASAGAFILLACPEAVMAPGTNVGAAHPVGFRGELAGEKVTNDAAAFIRAIAERRGRSAAWAERAVRDSVSATAVEAHALRVIDRIASSRVEIYAPRSPEFRAAGLTFAERLLHASIGPDLAFLFFLIGAGLLIFEFFSPGGIGAAIGIVFLAASVVMLGMLPVNIAGVVLLLAAMLLFAVEAQSPGLGVPAAAGVTCLVLGGLFLFDSSVPNARVSVAMLVAAAVLTTLFFGVVVQAVVRARKLPAPQTMPDAGVEGVVVAAVAPRGVVSAAGEEWTAETNGDPIAEGTRVRVVETKGLTVVVEPLPIETTTGGST